jgi:hypothetical protein
MNSIGNSKATDHIPAARKAGGPVPVAKNQSTVVTTGLASTGIPSRVEALKVSHLSQPMKVWQDQVKFHLALYELARKFNELSIEGKLLQNLPPKEFNELYELVDFSHENQELLKYQISFLFTNADCEQGQKYRDHYVSNVLNLLALQITGNQDLYQRLDDFLVPIVASSSSSWRDQPLLIDSKIAYSYANQTNSTSIPFELTVTGLLEALTESDPELRTQVATVGFMILYLIHNYYKVDRSSISPTDIYHELNQIFGHQATKPFVILDPNEKGLRGNMPEDFMTDPESYIAKAEKPELARPDPSTASYIFRPTGFPGETIVVPNESRDKLAIVDLKDGGKLFCKRINPMRVLYPEEEVELAEEARGFFNEVNQSQDKVILDAQNFVGIAYDGKGIFYLLSKDVEYDRVLNSGDQDIEAVITPCLQQIARLPDPCGNARRHDCLYQNTKPKPKVTVIDFETLPRFNAMRARYAV